MSTSKLRGFYVWSGGSPANLLSQKKVYVYSDGVNPVSQAGVQPSGWRRFKELWQCQTYEDFPGHTVCDWHSAFDVALPTVAPFAAAIGQDNQQIDNTGAPFTAHALWSDGSGSRGYWLVQCDWYMDGTFVGSSTANYSDHYSQSPPVFYHGHTYSCVLHAISDGGSGPTVTVNGGNY